KIFPVVSNLYVKSFFLKKMQKECTDFRFIVNDKNIGHIFQPPNDLFNVWQAALKGIGFLFRVHFLRQNGPEKEQDLV
ncbi:hypothetical protein DK853_42960, partial [Klebsiella oxytoca]